MTEAQRLADEASLELVARSPRGSSLHVGKPDTRDETDYGALGTKLRDRWLGR